MADASAAKMSKALMKNILQRKNVDAANHFALGIMGIACLYILYFWTRPLYGRIGAGSRTNNAFHKPVQMIRKVRRKIILDTPGFISGGHVVVFILYLAITLFVLFTNIDWANLSGFAKRLGWLTVLNMCLSIFLGLKHTPLSLLTDQSYEKLNCLHQIAGYSSIASLFLHTVVYITRLSKAGRLSTVIGQKAQVMGILAGISLLIIFLTAIFLRKNYYEAFYVIHILMVFFALILAGLHRPKLSITRSSYILVFAGSIWAVDRLLRLAKYVTSSYKNFVTITPLPYNGTRVVFSKPLKSAIPGQHYFIWIPGIRTFESHPFTCLSAETGEFIIAAQSGFTQKLYQRALKEPGSILKASMDGPYGNPPNLMGFTKVLFIAGGSGASYTCSLAVDLVRKLGHSTKTSLDFTLVLKHKAMTEWTSSQLNTLASSPIVSLHVHVTRKEFEESSRNSLLPLSNFISSIPLDFSSSSDTEKVVNSYFAVNNFPNSTEKKEIRSTVTSDTYVKATMDINLGRPNINSQISQAVNTSSTTERIAIVACGPVAMMVNIRRVVAENIRPEGPSLQLFSEQFGW
ncbi:Ferric/cupric reductase transmembrane component 2 [Erysiphe neolycopersici]|uniref:ferric-chelate reductase (NADPH) n=1 Tax=Erysiphe neolycopersici TaxID=212602 RepID=A0A420I3P5_9PEZI|nr:Ferric/cupric reductase transmembrane component 2 [Erysiphe neolycopersici]